MRFLKIVISIAAIIIAIAILLSGPGYRFGFWDYGDGLVIIRTLAIPAMIATIVAGMAFIAAIFTARDLAPVTLIAFIGAGLAAYTPYKMQQLVAQNPFIHDITTDFQDPPRIEIAADFDRKNPPEYLGDEIAPRSELSVTQSQQRYFPDIEARNVDLPPEDAAEHVRSVLTAMDIEILRDEATDAGWKIEGYYRSLWYGFYDDFIVRIEESEGGSHIDVRSKSRVGGSDLGANGKRVREFLARFDAAIAAD